MARKRVIKKKETMKATAAKEQAVVENVKAAAEKAVTEKAEKAAEEMETVKAAAEEIKTTAKETAKTAAKTAVKAAKEAKETVKKTAVKEAKEVAKKTAAKKTVKKDMKVRTFVEFYGKQVEEKEMIARVKKAWTKKGKKVGDIKTLELYVKPEEGAIYYVINTEETGSVEY